MTSIQSPSAMNDLKSFLASSGEMWNFLQTPVYLQCGVAAAAYFNHRIQDQVQAREEKITKRPTFWNISVQLARKLLQQLYPKRNVTTNEAKVYRSLCNKGTHKEAELDVK